MSGQYQTTRPLFSLVRRNNTGKLQLREDYRDTRGIFEANRETLCNYYRYQVDYWDVSLSKNGISEVKGDFFACMGIM